ncbi:hypothetical protein JX265_009689 [Neoarthrinium moseri]|uniref:C2 domain-containing protein n=1 Tax=Neoarthrinium moseri TaxID=1658444 RepID=A0A9P9WFN0_9PEZI|nr:hypothetical protein JX265_009689 [Neoarthrinium moseri]
MSSDRKVRFGEDTSHGGVKSRDSGVGSSNQSRNAGTDRSTEFEGQHLNIHALQEALMVANANVWSQKAKNVELDRALSNAHKAAREREAELRGLYDEIAALKAQLEDCKHTIDELRTAPKRSTQSKDSDGVMSGRVGPLPSRPSRSKSSREEPMKERLKERFNKDHEEILSRQNNEPAFRYVNVGGSSKKQYPETKTHSVPRRADHTVFIDGNPQPPSLNPASQISLPVEIVQQRASDRGLRTEQKRTLSSAVPPSITTSTPRDLTQTIDSDMSQANSAIGTLVLIIDRAENLLIRKTNVKRYPYVALEVGNEVRNAFTEMRGGRTIKWDQELRFTIYDLPNYYQLKLTIFNDDVTNEVIGETRINLRDIIVPGGGQNDSWRALGRYGSYAGEIKLEITYYDTRPKLKKAVAIQPSPVRTSPSSSTVLSAASKEFSRFLLTRELPEELRMAMKPERGTSVDCWTLNSSPELAGFITPLRVDSCPVIIPVSFRYPLHNALGPPPDPHPQPISPSKVITDEVVADLFNTYDMILGFYILLNGWIQIIVPEDFDYSYALSHRPSRFGGLYVSYIPSIRTPTAERSQGNPALPAVTSPQPSVSSARTTGQQTAFTSSSPARRPGFSQRGKTNVKIGSTVRLTIGDLRQRERIEGKIGVKTRMANGQHYLTIPTHMITEAIKLSKGPNFKSVIDREMAKVMFGEQELGAVVQTFDSDAESFPNGFMHDVSLVNVSNNSPLVSEVSTHGQLSWISEEEWHKIRFDTSKVFVLNDADIEAKTISIKDESHNIVDRWARHIQESTKNNLEG